MAPLGSRQDCSPAEALHPSQGEPSLGAHRASQKWYVASWNVRTLLDVEGSIETARGFGDVSVVDERKVDQVLSELDRYGVVVAGLQETKWFGSKIYKVGKSVILSSGRDVPKEGGSRQRGEGVAIVMSGPAVSAWKAGGSQWKAWSSRLVTATLETGKGKSGRLHVLSCYAPTFAASREEKDKFFDLLQDALSAIPSGECYVMLGDFNARVGSRAVDDDEWWYERGPHGYGELNEAGRDLLSFLSTNEATVCNTWFQKRRIYKQTWQHPKSHKWHCIDYVIMRKEHRRKCLDVCVKRGANCNTDHSMVRAKLVVGQSARSFRRASGRTGVKRWNVAKLQGGCEDDRGMVTANGRFLESVRKGLKEKWDTGKNVEEKWNVLSSVMCDAAKEWLGYEDRRQPDWFRESEVDLKPLFAERNRMHTVWISDGREASRRKYADARRVARHAVRVAKDAWFQRKASEAERGRNGGKVVWQCIRDIQRGRRGLVPVRSAVVQDENGNSCTTTEAQQERWRRHFSKILNIQSDFDMEELSRVRQRPTRNEMTEVPSEEEVMNAVGKLRNGKAGGESGILPEMVKAACCEEEFVNKLLDLVKDVWEKGCTPCAWRDSILVPIPKKGDLSNCDNWRGISLLDVVGKVVARILQERLQKLAEDELPESQCGFRAGRSCTDMIFTVRQFVEKSWEHQSKAFLTFIDLKKAYDSVPRHAMWLALEKLGVSEQTIRLIRSFHDNMRARVRLEGMMLEEIQVRNGLHQGCCMAPVLFNLYTCLAVERWLEKVRGDEGVGMTIQYKLDRKLFRRYTKNASEQRVTECQFADDGAILASMRPGAEKAALVYQQTTRDFGLTVSIPKTKHMVTGRLVEEEDLAPIVLEGGEVEAVEEFPYLGSLVDSSGKMDADVSRRVAQASKAFGALRKAVFLDKDLKLSTKKRVYNACVLSVLLYGAECWIPLKRHEKRLNTFYHRCIRTILGISNRQQWSERITMAEVRRRWGDEETVSEKVQKRRLEWLGHLARMPDHRLPKVMLFSWLPQPRPRCGPRKRWRDVVRKDLRNVEVGEHEWYAEASRSRAGWRVLCQVGLVNGREARTSQASTVVRDVVCELCSRSFRRESDKQRHKCLDERQKPVCEQRGATQCSQCQRWFRSRGGLAVHRCMPEV